LSGLATLGLGLASLGLYAVVAFAVIRRSRELGIRMALGAGSPQVVWLVMREVSILVTAGVIAGIGLSITALTLMGAYSPTAANAELVAPATDPMTFVFVAAILGSVGLVAAYFPARRAALADPLASLRAS
jgi:ABC-type antimicrobial peptide transport system permease subunit